MVNIVGFVALPCLITTRLHHVAHHTWYRSEWWCSRRTGVHEHLAPGSQTHQARPLTAEKIHRQRDEWGGHKKGVYFSEADTGRTTD